MTMDFDNIGFGELYKLRMEIDRLYNDVSVARQNDQKFAELIIQQCIDICRYHPSNIVSNNWNSADVATDIARQISNASP